MNPRGAVLLALVVGCGGDDVETAADAAPPADAVPLGADEPAYDPAQHALIITDSFEYATMDEANDAYPVTRGAEYVELTDGRGGTGNALRLRYGMPDGASDIIFGPETRLDAVGQWNGTLPEVAGPYSHFLFTSWFRSSPGSDPADNDDTGSGLKGFMFWWQNPVDENDRGRYETAVNRLLHPDDATRIKGANPDNATSGMDLYRTPDGRAPLWSDYADGAWHRFTMEIYTVGDPSGHFGQRFWLDGELVYSDVDIDVSLETPAGHYDFATAVSHFMVFGNYVTEEAASTGFTLDFDDWMAWTD